MDSLESPEEAAFRAGFREWLAANVPGPLLEESDAREAAERAWHRKLVRAGNDWLSFPEAYGGRGLPESFEAIFDHELGETGAPGHISQGHLAQALARFGTEQQKATHLRRLIEHTLRWCQGFSEPGAGSDLARLSTRACLSRASSSSCGHWRCGYSAPCRDEWGARRRGTRARSTSSC